MTLNSKQKGNRFEQFCAKLFRAYGFTCLTSREESKRLDDLGVDLVTNAPYNVQCKHVERLSTSYHQIINEMPTDKTPLIFHKRNNLGTVVVMRLIDFEELHLQNEHK